MNWKDLNIADYQYILPENRIAKFPLKERDASKLLYYKEEGISHHTFREIPELLPQNPLLVSNNTKVIPARIIFHKESGARIELFLLDPVSPSSLHEEVLATTTACTWNCMIGNAKKWKNATTLTIEDGGKIILEATRQNEQHVSFRWPSGESFSSIIEKIGQVPLPPYLKREVENKDKPRYQTIYSKYEGAVAAPTAGLHFTKEVLSSLTQREIPFEHLTLHVSAGTFQPMKGDIETHPMHSERVAVSYHLIKKILDYHQVVPVGTTSMRTLESLYWFGVRLEQGINEFNIQKMEPYQHKLPPLTRQQSLQNVLDFMDTNQMDQLAGSTEIFIFPGYQFRVSTGLITNFHLPASTLILLVAAFIGENWRKVYQEALNHDYRFLSYGDCSLLVPKL